MSNPETEIALLKQALGEVRRDVEREVIDRKDEAAKMSSFRDDEFKAVREEVSQLRRSVYAVIGIVALALLNFFLDYVRNPT